MGDKTKVSINLCPPLSVGIFLIFLFCKLAGHITWSWWWVTSPLWIPLVLGVAIFLGILLVIAIILLVIGFLKAIFGKKKK